MIPYYMKYSILRSNSSDHKLGRRTIASMPRCIVSAYRLQIIRGAAGKMRLLNS